MVEQVSNIGAFTYNPNPCGCYDFDDLDLNYSNYGYGCGYPGGVQGSIFGGMPYSGMVGSYNNQSYFDNMKQYQQFYSDYYVDQQKLQRNQDLRVNSPLEAIKGKYVILKDKITRGEEDQILKAYKDFSTAVANAYGPGEPSEIGARAATLYATLNGGTSIIDDIRENCRGSFGTGFNGAVTFGTSDTTSAEDLISQITGSEVGSKDKREKFNGRAIGAATVSTVAGIATKSIVHGRSAAKAAAAVKAGKTASKVKGGGVAGLVIAAGVFVLSLISSRAKKA